MQKALSPLGIEPRTLRCLRIIHYSRMLYQLSYGEVIRVALPIVKSTGYDPVSQHGCNMVQPGIAKIHSLENTNWITRGPR